MRVADVNSKKICESFDFVSKYEAFFSGMTDAPGEFQIAAALFLLSIAVARKWIFRSLPDMDVFSDRFRFTGKLLNLWFIILGKSRISRKSSGVINHVVRIAERIIGEQQLISEAFTPESLIKELSEKSERSTTFGLETICCWICDEIAWFFHLLKKRESYMASADALLSKIYDGRTHSRSTTGRGKETVWNPYLTCLLASTDYLPTLFDELKIRLGFMNRFIYVVGERKERKPLRTEPLTEEEQKEVKEIVAFLEALHEKTTRTMLEMTTEAKRVYDSFEEKIEKRIANENLGIKEGYWAQLPNLVVRLACLYRIGRTPLEKIRNYNRPTLTVESQDVRRAIGYARKAWGWFGKVIEMMQTTPTKTSLIDIVKELILEILRDGAERTRKEILKYILARVKVSIPTIEIARKQLQDEGKICQPKFGFYKLTEDCKTCKARGNWK